MLKGHRDYIEEFVTAYQIVGNVFNRHYLYNWSLLKSIAIEPILKGRKENSS